MPEDYIVQQGESVASIAASRGFSWQTLWNHGNNASLKQLRKDPDILLPGDVLHIPDKEKKQESRGTEARHKFKKKGTPAKFKMKLVRTPKETKEKLERPKTEVWKYAEADNPIIKPEPAANEPYELYADGKLVKNGNTDGDGILTATLPPGAQGGILITNPGKPSERTLELNFRQMDPIDEIPGLCKRLHNLGYPCPVGATEMNDDVAEAIRAFQKKEGLPVNGQANDATKNKLKQVYGG